MQTYLDISMLLLIISRSRLFLADPRKPSTDFCFNNESKNMASSSSRLPKIVQMSLTSWRNFSLLSNSALTFSFSARSFSNVISVVSNSAARFWK